MIRFLKENKEFLGIILFSVLTTLFIVPMSFLISNYSELEINLCYLTDQFLVISTFALIIAILIIRFLPEKFKKFLITILFVVGLFTYFEYLFIMPQLGQLKGSAFNLGNYAIPMVIETVLALVVLFSCFFFYKKEKFIKVLFEISIVLLLIQGITFVFFSKPLMQEICKRFDPYTYATDDTYSFKNYIFDLSKYNVYSKEQNVVIIVVDAFGKGIFDELLLRNPEYKEIFKDFEYYPNMTSMNGQTSFAVPAIFTGHELEEAAHDEKYYKNLKQDFTSENALLKALKKDGFKNHIYPFASNIFYLHPSFIDNLKSKEASDTVNRSAYARLLKNTVELYALPVILKKNPYDYMTKITMDKSSQEFEQGNSYYIEDDFYKKFKYKIRLDNEKKVFKYYHLRGLHEPFMLDENYNIRNIGEDDGDALEKTTKLYIGMLKAYLDRLKEAGIYDKTLIVIMGDHGSGKIISQLQTENEIAENPLFLLKDFNKKQDEMKVVGDVYADVADTKDPILYALGLADKKWDPRFPEKYKETLKIKCEKNVEFFKNLELKPFQYKYPIRGDVPSALYQLVMNNKSVAMLVSNGYQVDQEDAYVVLENMNNPKEIYASPIPKNYTYWDSEELYYRWINFRANNIPNGRYELKILVLYNKEYYNYKINESIVDVSDNKVKFIPTNTNNQQAQEPQKENNANQIQELTPFEYKYKIRGDVPSGLRELKMDGKTVNMYISNGYQVDQQEAYVVLENMKNPAEKYAAALPKDYTQIQSDKQYYRWINFAANKIPKGKYEIKILVLYNNEYYNYKINEYIIDVFDKKVNFTDTGYWLTHKSE